MMGSNGTNGNNGAQIGTDRVKQGLAQMLKGGVIVSGWHAFVPPPQNSFCVGRALTSESVDGGGRGAFGVQKLPFGLAWLGLVATVRCW